MRGIPYKIISCRGSEPVKKPEIKGSSKKSFSTNRFKYIVEKKILPNYILYLFLLPALVYLAIFHYWPMYGVQIAFKDFKAGLGIAGSPWVGLKHFRMFTQSFIFSVLLKNTITLSLYGIFAGLPFTIILAISLQYSFSTRFKKFAQTITYAPHFISQVVMVGMLLVLLSSRNGIVNILLRLLNLNTIPFLEKAEYFKHIYVLSGVWQSVGWSSILYIAVLTNVSVELHEAAIIDGANKFQRVKAIDIPVILPTIVIMLTLSMGRVLSLGFEKIYLMQNDINIIASEVISTYTYKIGILSAEHSYSTAIGLFNNVINLLLLVIVNWISKRLTENSLF